MRLLKFSAPWCNPCKTLSARLQENPIGIDVIEIDVEEDESMAEKYNVRSLPTCVLLNNEGQEVKRWQGFRSSLINEIKDACHE